MKTTECINGGGGSNVGGGSSNISGTRGGIEEGQFSNGFSGG